MKTDENSGLRAAVRQFEKHNPKVFRRDGSVRFSAYAIWKEPGEKPYREDDLCAVLEASLNDSTPENVILEQPHAVRDQRVGQYTKLCQAEL